MRYDDLFQRLTAELDAGSLTTADLEQVLSRAQRRDQRSARPDIAGVLLALGAIVAFAGVALLYGINFDQLSHGAQIATPFLFPAAAFGATILLVRNQAACWQRDLAGLVGVVCLILADLVAGGVIDPDRVSAYALVVSVIGIALVLALHRFIGSLRVTGFGLGLGLAVLFICLADLVFGLDDRSGAWVLLAEAIAAAGVAAALYRRDRRMASYAAGWAAVLGYSASLFGQPQYDWNSLNVWHVVLSLTVLGCFAAATAFEMDGLIWIGAAGALIWLGLIADLVGTSSGWAVSLVLIGAGLAGVGWLVTTMRRRSRR